MPVISRDASGLAQRGFDVIIVGAGSAGAALARRLSDDASCSVLLIEAGSFYGSIDRYPAPLRNADSLMSSLPGSPDSWSFVGHLRDDLAFPITRGRVVGGSSAVNGAQFTRARQEDYDSWTAVGGQTWSYEAVLPHLKALENDLDFGATAVHGASGPIRVQRPDLGDLSPVSEAFIEAASDQGFPWDPDLNGMSTGGVGLLPLNVVDGIRQNTGACYVEPIVHRPSITVLDQYLVTRVVVVNGVAIGVEGRRAGQLSRILADQIVLSASGINSPFILMHSGIGPADELQNAGIDVVCSLSGVGQDFSDHPTIALPFRISSRARGHRPRPIAEVNLNYHSGEPRPVAEDMRMFPFLSSKAAMLTRIGHGKMNGRLADQFARLRSVHPARAIHHLRGSSLHAIADEMRHYGDLAFHCGVGNPDSRGSIRVSSGDPVIPPEIRYRYMSSEVDLRRMRGAVRLAADLLGHPSYRKLGARITGLSPAQLQDNHELDRWICNHLGTSYHTSGTCRMGPESDESAVVDEYCRVRGVRNLRVVDISVIPTLMTRGPNATAIMLGERAAEFIAGARSTPDPLRDTS